MIYKTTDAEKQIDAAVTASAGIIELFNSGTDDSILSVAISGLGKTVESIEDIQEAVIAPYRKFLELFLSLCQRSSNPEYIASNKDLVLISVRQYAITLNNIKKDLINKSKTCCMCKNKGFYIPFSQLFREGEKPLTYNLSEDLKRSYCPYCSSDDRDRMITAFMTMNGIEEAVEGFRLLQIAPSRMLDRWISDVCPQIQYDTIEPVVEGGTIKSNIRDLNKTKDETYDFIIWFHAPEHLEDDEAVLNTMNRVLKWNGKIVFVLPFILDAETSEDKLGLVSEGNQKGFERQMLEEDCGKDGILEKMKKHFCVRQLGIEYFGEDILFQNGISDAGPLYVLTKSDDVDFGFDEKSDVDENLCENGPLVSVIMSAYNHGPFVAQTIESVLNQSYRNIEFLVADDASTDDTAEIMHRYDDYYAKAFYYDENAGGRGSALIEMASGKYLAIINSDDFWEPDKIALQVQYLEEHEECGICFTWVVSVNDDLSRTNTRNVFRKTNRSREEWMRFFWQQGNCLSNPSSLARRGFKEASPYWQGVFNQIPDFYDWVEAIQKCDIHIITKNLVYMRMHDTVGIENQSAHTAENNARTIIEYGMMWLNVLKRMDDDFFKRAFQPLFVNKDANSKEELMCERFFLLKSVKGVFINLSAFYYLAEYNSVMRNTLVEKYGYGRNQLKKDIIGLWV